MNDILLSPVRLSELEALIEKSVRRALSQSLTTNDEEIGGIELARQVTRLSAARVYALVSQRAIPHKKRGNRLTFRRSELLEWLDEGDRQQLTNEYESEPLPFGTARKKGGVTK